MLFTALHRAAGSEPGPITDALLDAAVAARAEEADDLDWKRKMAPTKELPNGDMPKDIAAMANSGGGVIVFGVRAEGKAAAERVDAGALDEGVEQALRRVAINAITPPVLGLHIVHLDGGGNRAIVVAVPPSLDAPHLIYKKDYFAAPYRVNAYTDWMRERQIEAMYRARFDERRNATQALDRLYEDALVDCDSSERLWLVAVAHPRIPQQPRRMKRAEASDIIQRGGRTAIGMAPSYRGAEFPIQNVEPSHLRAGLRRWIAYGRPPHEAAWDAIVGVHDDGSVTVAKAIGAVRLDSDRWAGAWVGRSWAIETAVADLVGLIAANAAVTANDEYDVRVGLAWEGSEPIEIGEVGPFGQLAPGAQTRRFVPVETTLNARTSSRGLRDAAYTLAVDCLNQVGVRNAGILAKPEELNGR
ncbi:ATP-binding protein [Microbacterium protaetiae]|uniref:ATP-binding protein n=1 Tax=Microbacterium protaetiae TaxID=2509458 RepID=A0A4V0YDJ4_9MICO|nr:ATP-binding protein [Microbacterium protaetiae]QAY60921.1 ATP-binding protein [Microbacterium protaetiae]